jgi:ABC-type branched-subunit amino acid transport system substrate-binding protein
MRRTALALAALTLAAGAVAGCGSSDDSSSDTGASTGAGTTGASTSDGSASSGKPIKVMLSYPADSTIGYAYPEMEKTVTAAINGINKRGGINGTQVELLTCNNGNNPNKAAQCAQQAVKEGAVALVGSYAFVGATGFYSVLDSAKIPNLGNTATEPADWTDPMSFPTTAAPQAYVAGAGFSLANSGCKKVAQLAFDDKGFDAFIQYGDVGIKEGGAEALDAVRFPATTKDFTAPVQQAIDEGADCVLTLGPGPVVPPILRAIQSGGNKVRLGGANHIGEQLSSLGTALDGVTASDPALQPTLDPAPDADPMMKQFAEDMKASGFTDPAYLTISGLSQYIGAQFFAQVAMTLPKGQVTAQGLIDAANKATFDPKIMGPTDFTASAPFKEAPRLHNYTMFIEKVEDGKIVQVPPITKNFTEAFEQQSSQP